MKLGITFDEVVILRAVGVVPMDKIMKNEHCKMIGVTNELSYIFRKDEKAAFITRDYYGKKGWKYQNDGLLHPERLSNRTEYVGAAIDVVAPNFEYGEGILEEVIKSMSFEYNKMKERLVDYHYDMMRKVYLNVLEEIFEKKREIVRLN